MYQQQENHRIRTDSCLIHWGWGLKYILLVPNLSLDYVVVKDRM